MIKQLSAKIIRSKIGSPEYKEKMRNRPQCQPDKARERLKKGWLNRKEDIADGQE